MSYLFVILAFLWSIVWTIATIGVYDKTTVCDEQTNVCSVNYGYLFLLLLSFYWTHQVIVVREKRGAQDQCRVLYECIRLVKSLFFRHTFVRIPCMLLSQELLEPGG